jgi:hypothetical protein
MGHSLHCNGIHPSSTKEKENIPINNLNNKKSKKE